MQEAKQLFGITAMVVGTDALVGVMPNQGADMLERQRD